MPRGWTAIYASDWEDREFGTPEEKLLEFYVMAHVDAAGVFTWDTNHIKSYTKIPAATANKLLKRLAARRILLKAGNGHPQCWYNAGIYRFLQRGRCSPKQLDAAMLALLRWDRKRIFGETFVTYVLELYAREFLVRLPNPHDYCPSDFEKKQRVNLNV